VTRALALAVAALALLPAPAGAHALLEETTPERGARLNAVPDQVALRFSEPVEAEFGAVRVFDSRGREVQAGAPLQRGAEVAVRLRDGLGDDGYTVTYRVISADSHPVSGGFVFVVGDAPAPAATVGELLGDDDAGPVTGTAFGVARAVQFAAIALGLGAVAFAWLCWLPGLRATAGDGDDWAAASTAFSARLRALLLVSAAAGAVSAAVAIVLQGAVAGGTTVADALDSGVVGDVLDTRFGTVWALGIVAWLGVAAAGLALPRTGRLVALAVPLAALSLLPALGGHASVQPPVALLAPANVLHVVAMGAWLGGVAVLVLVLRAATARLEPGERTRLLAATVARFSAMAGVAIAVLLASGIVQGVVEVRTPANLVETAFGRAVLVKVVLFAGLVTLGAVNRRRLLPALTRAAREGEPPGRVGALLRRTLRAELAVGAAVLATTGALAGYAPSIARASARTRCTSTCSIAATAASTTRRRS
jgi:copper transport protein